MGKVTEKKPASGSCMSPNLMCNCATAQKKNPNFIKIFILSTQKKKTLLITFVQRERL